MDRVMLLPLTCSFASLSSFSDDFEIATFPFGVFCFGVPLPVLVVPSFALPGADAFSSPISSLYRRPHRWELVLDQPSFASRCL